MKNSKSKVYTATTIVVLIAVFAFFSYTVIDRIKWAESYEEGLELRGYSVVGVFKTEPGEIKVIQVPATEDIDLGFTVYESEHLQKMNDENMVILQSVETGRNIFTNVRIEAPFSVEQFKSGLEIINPTSIKTHTLIFMKEK